jgi:branched-chain amino acid transport system permease protein
MINRYLLPELNGLPDKVGLSFDVTSVSFGIFGFMMLAIMLLRPEGLIPSGRRRLELREDEIDPTATPPAGGDTQVYEVRQA